MLQRAEKIYLALAGMTLILVGSFIGLTPVDYYQRFNLDVLPSINYLSELRGVGGTLLVFGLLACVAIRDSRVADTALNATTLIFASFAAFRMLSLSIDGMPGTEILAAMLVELTLALTGLWLIRQRKAPTTSGCNANHSLTTGV